MDFGALEHDVRYWHKADMPFSANECPLSGAKRTSADLSEITHSGHRCRTLQMRPSGFDQKPILASRDHLTATRRARYHNEPFEALLHRVKMNEYILCLSLR